MDELSTFAPTVNPLTAEQEDILSGLDDIFDDLPEEAPQVEAPAIPGDGELAANFLGPVPAMAEPWFAGPLVTDRAKRSVSIEAAQAKIAAYRKQNKADLNRAWAEENQRRRVEQEAWRKTPAGRASEAARKREAYEATIAALEEREVREYRKVEEPVTQELKNRQKAESKARCDATKPEADKAAEREADKRRKRMKRAEAKAAKLASCAP